MIPWSTVFLGVCLWGGPEPAPETGEDAGREEPPGEGQPQAEPGTPEEETSDPEAGAVELTPEPTSGEKPGPTPTAAAGGQGYVPLPAPPPPEDPDSIEREPWRGRFWIDMRIDVTAPLAGDPPAEGNVVSGGGTLGFGWRITNWVGLTLGISQLVHDAEDVPVLDPYGNRVLVREYGYLTVFDFLVGRFFLPVKGRFQPFVETGGGGALRLPPSHDEDESFGWQVRGGLGFDGWVGRNFTLGVVAAYRLVGLEGTLGHALQVGGGAGAHW
jgi:hypothetical protein